jgi:solute carrier family 7 (cationic amino acid transporter), member 1
LILRYVPPDEVPLPSSLKASFRLSQENDEEKVTGPLGDEDHGQGTSEINDVIVVESIKDPLIEKQLCLGHRMSTNTFKL